MKFISKMKLGKSTGYLNMTDFIWNGTGGPLEEGIGPRAVVLEEEWVGR